MKKTAMRDKCLIIVLAAVILSCACGCRTEPPRSSLPTRDAQTPAEEAVVIAGYVLYFFSGCGYP
jgi:hypothetical protein